MEKIKINPEICKKCIYHGYNTPTFCLCSYILIEKHSRIFDGGKRVVEKGYCDKFISYDNNEELKRINEAKEKDKKIITLGGSDVRI